MKIDLRNGSVFFGEKHVPNAREVIDLLSDQTALSKDEIGLNQEIWSLGIRFSASDDNLLAEIFLSKSRKLFKIFELPKLIQNYVITNRSLFPISENSVKALRHIISKNLDVGTRISVSDFAFLEQLFVDNKLEVIRDDGLQNFFGRAIIDKPKYNIGLMVSPWPYQMIGIEWILSRLENHSSGSLLADFMGLGKTLQSIGVISYLAQGGMANRLVIVPNHLVINWKKEINKFAPHLNVLIHRGSQRYGISRLLKDYDLVITTYPVLIKDISIFAELEWEIVIADEAQAIKNRRSRSSKCVKLLKRNYSVAVSGTPLETNLDEYYSLCEFISPETLGDWNSFQSRVNSSAFDPISLHQETTHLKLRRTLDDVGSQLPPVVIVPHVLEWPEEQDDIYEDVRLEALRNYPKSGGFQASLMLRQLTTHPRLLGLGSNDLTYMSPKFQTLIDIVEEVFANGERALVFTAFNEMNNLIVRYFQEKFPQYIIASLYGETSAEERQKLVDEINAENTPGLLVCNVIVAGTGLNIQGANHVIHYNLEWNPAKEDQASWRVVRPGQERNVFIHRLMYENTIDEIIDLRIQSRRQLAAQVVEGFVEAQDYMAGLGVSPGQFRIRN